MASTNSALVVPPSPGGTNGLDIRGIKGPVEIPGTYTWLWWVLAAVVIAALAWYAWRKFRIRKPSVKPALVIPPHRKAKDRLRAAGGLMSDPYQFCSLVSDVLRAYVEERFELHAPERTTEEFMDELRVSAALRLEHKTLLEDFLSRCDLVKFARFEPTEPEMQSLLDAAVRFVDETAPIGGELTKTEEAKAGA